ncbi:MAG: DNA adenine methylase [Bacillota bacterium]|nr:DNA adenine methylase [Bacillota bacterium]
MDSFIGWIGGKKLLRKAIIERFPEDGIDRYIEVFGGGGWVLFAKDSHAPLEVFNDVNSDLINLYRCIKYHREELQRQLEYTLVSREQLYDFKEQLSCRGLTDIQRAARYYSLIKISFGCGMRTFRASKRNLQGGIEYLAEIQDRLKSVVIENKDFESLIKVYDRPGALFYLDPPYFGTEKYYDNAFTEADHRRLCEALKGIKGRFILSYNDCEFIRELYKGFNVEAIDRSSNLTGKSKPGERFNELIIRNY